MNIKVGNDIVEVDRIKNSFNKFNDRFKNKVFTKNEIEYCESKGIHKYESYAGRFSAKEAVFKAISEELDGKYSIDWKDIEILNNKEGKPFVNLKNSNLNINIDISISHTRQFATATAVAVYE